MTLIHDHIHVGGRAIASTGRDRIDVVDPDSEGLIARVPAGTAADVDAAVRAARAALPGWAATPVAERAAVLRSLADALEARGEEMARQLTAEVGVPLELSRTRQVGAPVGGLRGAADLIEALPLEERIGGSLVVREPVGVAAGIAPWNFPLLLGMNKIAPALAAGCTVVFKPSEVTPDRRAHV